AAVLAEYNQPLEIREMPIPELEPGALLVRVDAATICGTDVHISHGQLTQFSKLPLIMGHEIVGTIVALRGREKDAADQPLREGDQIVWAYPWCGECYWCTIARQPTLCPNAQMYGWGPCDKPPYLLGGLADYAYVRPKCHVLKVPEGLDPAVVAAATCSLRTVVHGFERLGMLGGIGIQETTVIMGCGPVGLWALALSVVSGAAKTIVIGAPTRRLQVAKKWGADVTIDLEEISDPDKRQEIILGLTEGRGADLVIECAGPAAAFQEGLELVRRGGRVLVIGSTDPNPITIHPTAFNLKMISVVGLLSGAIPHYYKALQFLKNNWQRFPFTDMISNVYSLDQVNQALKSMDAFQEVKPAILPGGK
ncbi:MAG: zinc-binding dehydrogenase, partial [Dehalococcoidia bacterium]|nr:zinc-binding dehydrogenase [Dehalococcoidia bacterium]